MESIIARIFVFRNKLQVNFIYYGLVLIFLCIISFFLGLSTKFMNNRPTFSFVSAEEENKDFIDQKNELFGKVSTSTIVASKTGKKYYFVWCKGAINIKQNKKIYFETESLAQKAGYTIAANCK